MISQFSAHLKHFLKPLSSRKHYFLEAQFTHLPRWDYSHLPPACLCHLPCFLGVESLDTWTSITSSSSRMVSFAPGQLEPNNTQHLSLTQRCSRKFWLTWGTAQKGWRTDLEVQGIQETEGEGGRGKVKSWQILGYTFPPTPAILVHNMPCYFSRNTLFIPSFLVKLWPPQ